MTTVVVTRHGETAWTREERIQGWAPVAMTEAGREQVRALGVELGRRYDVDRVLSSDLRRTAETTELLRDDVDAPVTWDEAWRERDFGVFQGLLASAWFERFPAYDLWENGIDAARETPESGESLVDLRERIVAAWEGLLDDCGPDETVLVVAHGGPIRLVLGHVKGLDVAASMEQTQAMCAINEFDYDAETEETHIVCENETAPPTDGR
ncbi:histidine phosphatase family protein [Halocalculus aciditolerans]|uniref:Alpha-ribazole phosphatase n=1 Tax=Halocalculus aciditolerans TaxID=1383812 RepID=A0A830F9A4_9EURY|nr:histidine phosphatase family protein [Halocalculus aciditolerans]GGL52287.1 alpha-ribazole phosphatase [Halocalculus aciditolerans]